MGRWQVPLPHLVPVPQRAGLETRTQGGHGAAAAEPHPGFRGRHPDPAASSPDSPTQPSSGVPQPARRPPAKTRMCAAGAPEGRHPEAEMARCCPGSDLTLEGVGGRTGKAGEPAWHGFRFPTETKAVWAAAE